MNLFCCLLTVIFIYIYLYLIKKVKVPCNRLEGPEGGRGTIS
jgi:hypothetical protein